MWYYIDGVEGFIFPVFKSFVEVLDFVNFCHKIFLVRVLFQNYPYTYYIHTS